MGLPQDPRALLKQADEKTKSMGWWDKFRSQENDEDRAEQAGDLYKQAAVAFTVQKQDYEAAKAHQKAAQAFEKSNQIPTAAQQYVLAFERFEKTPQILEGIPCLEASVNLWVTVQGNFVNAGTNQEKLALFYETGDKRNPPLNFDLAQVLEAYQLAYDYYDNANSMKAAVASLKVAEYAALTGNVPRATSIIDETIRKASMNPKTSSFVGNYIPMGACVHLASNDPSSFNKALGWYCEIDRMFANSRKPQVFQHLAQLVEEGDDKKFQKAFDDYKYDNVLQDNTDRVLRMIESSIAKREDDFS